MPIMELSVIIEASPVRHQKRNLLVTYEYWEDPLPCAILAQLRDPGTGKAAQIPLVEQELMVIGHEAHVRQDLWTACREPFMRFLSTLDADGWDIAVIANRCARDLGGPIFVDLETQGHTRWEIARWVCGKKSR